MHVRQSALDTKKWFMGIGLACACAALSGCGAQNFAAGQSASQFLRVDSATQTVTLKLIAGFTPANGWLNFDGYANGQMTVQVPVGYKVTVEFSNDGGVPADIGVYGANGQLAFPGAGDSIQAIELNAQPGIVPGSSETVTFTASQAGMYRIENLENRFPQFGQPYQSIGMWVGLNVVSGGSPGITVSA